MIVGELLQGVLGLRGRHLLIAGLAFPSAAYGYRGGYDGGGSARLQQSPDAYASTRWFTLFGHSWLPYAFDACGEAYLWCFGYSAGFDLRLMIHDAGVSLGSPGQLHCV
ncbi:hypothetical protein AB0K16_50510 [Nonomuraea jabiensis]|uniref:hypothetical protein n=1 Tax=Nonomuraea jabiensis TaxID=882448 RepID=UPI00341C2EDE